MQKEGRKVQKQALRAQAESAFLLNLGFIVSLFYTVSFGVLGMPMSLKALEIHKDYRYDALGRLSDVIDGQSGAVLEHYEYDGVGNLLLKVLNGARYTYTYDAAHQLKSMEAPDGLHTYDYDTAGRLIAEYLNGKAVVRYHYGYLDKVIAVERDGATTRYLYDAEGNLATKIYPDGRHENYAWDGMALILKGDTVYINEPHASGGLPIASTTNGVTTYHSYDALGTSIADYDEAGNPIKRYESTAYGEGTIQDDTTGSARFTGKLYDTEMAAYIFPFRNYDPVIVRWRSSDPIGFPDGPNNHYSDAVPTMQIDPWGLHYVSIKFSGGKGNSWSGITHTFISTRETKEGPSTTWGLRKKGFGEDPSKAHTTFTFDVSESEYGKVDFRAEYFKEIRNNYDETANNCADFVQAVMDEMSAFEGYSDMQMDFDKLIDTASPEKILEFLLKYFSHLEQ